MAVPVITTTTSILEFRAFETWTYQPYATNSPTSWNASGLPTGMSFDLATGEITGAATTPGVYEIGIVATNGTGTSTPLVITCGITSGSSSTPANEIDVTIDLQTQLVSFGDSSGTDAPIASFKSGDVVYFRMRFIKGGVVADLDLTDLYFTVKGDDTESTILASSDTWIQDGTGENSSYLMTVNFNEASLTSFLGDNEDPAGTHFDAICEFEWVGNHAEPLSGTFRTSSKTFLSTMTRELHPNA
jgi:hypothetical protein